MEYKELEDICKNAIKNNLCFRMQFTLKIQILKEQMNVNMQKSQYRK